MVTSETLGIVIVFTGIALLLITFGIACFHLFGEIRVFPTPSLFAYFGEALSPLIEASIRVLYLGLMCWIASTITAKGLPLLLQTKLQEKNIG